MEILILQEKKRVRRSPQAYTPTVPKVYAKFTIGVRKPAKHPLSEPKAAPSDVDVEDMATWLKKGLKR